METNRLNELTVREHEILIKVAEGKSLLDIAHELQRSLKTIESHRLSLGRKLKVSNRVELTKIAIEHGLITVKTPASSEVAATLPARKGPIHDDPRAQQYEHAIADRLYDKAGSVYINELSCALCDVLGFAYAGVCVHEPGGDGQAIIRSLAHSDHGRIADQFFYSLEGTPCAAAIEDGAIHLQSKARLSYPRDKILAELMAEAYYGVALKSLEGGSIGVLWLIDTKPCEHHETTKKLLDYYSVRVSPVVTELEKARSALMLCETRGERLSGLNHKLRQKNDELDQLAGYYAGIAERMSDGLVVLSADWHIDYANERFAEIVASVRDDLVGLSILELLTPQGVEKFKSMQEARRTDRMKHYKVDAKLPDGGVKEVLVAPRTRYDQQGGFIGSFAIVSDQADI